jgi:hypothetical protein
VDSYSESSAITKVTAGRADGQVLGPWRCPPSAVSPRGPVLSERDFPTPHHFLLCCCGGRGGGFWGVAVLVDTTLPQRSVLVLPSTLCGGCPSCCAVFSEAPPGCPSAGLVAVFCSFATRSDSPSGRFPGLPASIAAPGDARALVAVGG